jgi:hypothetical protein
MEKSSKILWIISVLGALLLFPNSRLLPSDNSFYDVLNIVLLSVLIFIGINIPILIVNSIVRILIRLELAVRDLYNFFRYVNPLRRMNKKR